MNASNTRVLVACSMKSGSTYVSKILARYLDANFADLILGYYGYREQNLHEGHFTPELGSRFVLHLHIKPYPPHLELIERHEMMVVYQWRNLGDTILSVDDHILREYWENPVIYIDDGADYRSQSRDARHKFLIQHGLPWYISFHLAWKRIGDPEWLIRCSYEDMTRDTFSFFSRIVQGLGLESDHERLRDILDTHVHDARFNVGVAGRSVSGLSEENKTLLERMLIEHPQDLGDLLHELPWWPSSRGRTSTAGRHEGGMIRMPGELPDEQKVYLVRDGKRRWITSEAWLLQDGRRWEDVKLVPREELDEIPLGPPLRLP